MKRIAVLCNGINNLKRGSETFAMGFSKHLSRHFDVDVIGINDTNTKFRDDFLMPWRNGRAYAESYYFGKHLFKHNVLEKYDLVLNNAGFPCSYWCKKIRDKCGVPYITRERGGGKEEYLSRLFNPDFIVYLTNEQMNRSSTKIPNDVVPNGVNIDKFSKSVKKSDLVSSLERPLYLATSALVAYKRNHLIIDAVSSLNKGTLIQTSDGHLRERLLKYGSDKLDDRFRYLGVLSENELIELYNSCDVYLNASGTEGFGNVYIEAMASGLPIVSENDERRRWIIGSAGKLVDCNNRAEFASAISYCLETDWGDIPLNQSRKFSWDIVSKKYVEVIKSIIEK